MTRRRVLVSGAALAGLGLAGCFPDRTDDSPSSPVEPFLPEREVDADDPVDDVIALSGADLDTLLALGVTPLMAWDPDGTGPRPWRPGSVPGPDWDGAGLPPARTLAAAGADAVVMLGADPSTEQLRAYEAIAPVVAARPRPTWREHVRLVADATGTNDFGLTERTVAELEGWARAVRGRGIGAFSVVLGRGPRHPDDPGAEGEAADEPVPTLAAGSPLVRELEELDFSVLSHIEPRPYSELDRDGIEVLYVDTDDPDLLAAVRQPSVSSLPWLLERLAPRD